MKKFFVEKLNPRTHNAAIVIPRTNENLEFRKTKNNQIQAYGPAGVNSKGAASIFLVMTVLAAVLAIALGSSSMVATEIRSSLDSGQSVAAFYAAESGIEQAMYDRFKSEIQPTGEVCGVDWTIVSDPAKYCLIITQGDISDYTSITNIQSVGDYKTTRRSIEITLN